MPRYHAIPTDHARALQAGGPDANGMPPERAISDGTGQPCRHCLRQVPAGAPYLILSYRPFPTLQPYAEQGPIFLCAEACERYADEDRVPPMFLEWPRLLIRGYGTDDRIVYGTGTITGTAALDETAGRLLADPQVAYVHARSASNTCFQCRITGA